MSISRDEVEHVAHLARLGLSEEEKTRMQRQLSQILETMRAIDQPDTTTIPPTTQVIPIDTIMRDDDARPSEPMVDILRNAPSHEAGFFKVPPVLETGNRDE